MKQNHVEKHVSQIVESIDNRMSQGAIPRDALTFADVCKHANEPFGDIAGLSEFDRSHVINRVDEILRIRAGGVD